MPTCVSMLDAETQRALRMFVRRVEERCDILDALAFGSRARGDHAPDSDADLAVVLKGSGGNRHLAGGDMAEIAFDVMLETGISIAPMPFWEGELERPDLFSNPALIANIIRDGLRL